LRRMSVQTFLGMVPHRQILRPMMSQMQFLVSLSRTMTYHHALSRTMIYHALRPSMTQRCLRCF
jgi:hypothetical protein